MKQEETLSEIKTNYPVYCLRQSLIVMKTHLKSVIQSRAKHPDFYFPDAEVDIKARIKALKKAIKTLSNE